MIYLFSGENDFLINQEINLIKDKFIDKNSGLEHFQAEDITPQRLEELLMVNSLFSTKKLVIVENFDQNKELGKVIEKLIDQIAPDSDVILSAIKPDRRLTWFKLIKKHGKVKDFLKLSEYQAASFTMSYVKSRSGQIDHASASFLVENVGVDQWSLKNEVDKLLAYDNQITKSSIKKLVEPSIRETIFNLLDAVVKGNRKKAHLLYEQLAKKEIDSHQFIAMMAWQLHNMLVVKTNLTISDQELAKRSGLSPFVIKKNKALLSGISIKNIKEMIGLSLDADISLKLKNVDKNQRAKLLIDQISQIFN